MLRTMIFRIYIIWVESFISLKKKKVKKKIEERKKSLSHDLCNKVISTIKGKERRETYIKKGPIV